jgi:hypothetical protein
MVKAKPDMAAQLLPVFWRGIIAIFRTALRHAKACAISAHFLLPVFIAKI